VHNYFGGDLLEAEVLFQDGTRQGFHYWNRLAGVEVDLTRAQFKNQEVVQEPRVIKRLPGLPWQAEEQYLVFLERVEAALRKRPLSERVAAVAPHVGHLRNRQNPSQFTNTALMPRTLQSSNGQDSPT